MWDLCTQTCWVQFSKQWPWRIWWCHVFFLLWSDHFGTNDHKWTNIWMYFGTSLKKPPPPPPAQIQTTLPLGFLISVFVKTVTCPPSPWPLTLPCEILVCTWFWKSGRIGIHVIMLDARGKIQPKKPQPVDSGKEDKWVKTTVCVPQQFFPFDRWPSSGTALASREQFQWTLCHCTVCVFSLYLSLSVLS